ncbi:enhancer of split mgamma protein-like [Engraulis encrasicolus]|uniref:enhancer of split mgamma protein-like n=1 Tax=Engraulis encrasicolus TaxID=184585 RepID=UPI002FD08D5B
MAPTITTTADHPKDYMSLSHKLRKPIVEKLRRDRINNCIEELKALLGPQLLNQQPETKLEKADILEMTVCLLRRHLQQKTLYSLNVGFPTQEIANSLSKDGAQTHSHGAVLNHLQTLKISSKEAMEDSVLSQTRVFDLHTLGKENIPTRSSPWRPW